MKSPFCGGDMQAGKIHFDGRSRLRWRPEGMPKSGLDRFWDDLGGVGELIGAEYDWTGIGGKIRGDYCPACQKMILETKIAK